MEVESGEASRTKHRLNLATIHTEEREDIGCSRTEQEAASAARKTIAATAHNKTAARARGDTSHDDVVSAAL